MRNIVSVLFTEIRFLIMKLQYRKRFSWVGIERFSPNTEITIDKKGSVKLGNKVRAHTGTRIKVRPDASIDIGNDVSFNYGCMLIAHKHIVVGNGCEIGPNVCFYDHDHDVKECSIKEGKYISEDIILGKNVWIGANAIILKGVIIGDNCVVAAGTVVSKGIYPSNSLIRTDRKIKVIENYAK